MHGASNDAAAFQDLLLDLGVPQNRIRILQDYNATSSGILSEIKSVPDDPDLHLIIHIATHGLLYDDSHSIVHYLLAHDSHLDAKMFPSWIEPAVTRVPKAMSTGEFLSRIHAASPKKKLVAIDACYSGNARWEYTDVGRADDSSGTIVLAACGSRQLAFEQNNGRFTLAMLQVLRSLWYRGQRFEASRIHTEIVSLLDEDPYIDRAQQSQIFHFAGEAQFWFAPPGGPDLTESEYNEQQAVSLFFKARTALAQGFLAKAFNLATKAREHYPVTGDIAAFLSTVEKEMRNSDVELVSVSQINELRSAMERPFPTVTGLVRKDSLGKCRKLPKAFRLPCPKTTYSGGVRRLRY